ncbi:MAG: hypothetical protein WC390_06465 [Sulfurimonas sp.]|jgi:ADP-heptose:LPS heptosyltransferase
MSIKSIAYHVQGGIGDVILANRFIPAIKETYPNAKIKLFYEKDRPNHIFNLWPDNYELGFEKIYWKSEHFTVKSQFGVEDIPAHPDNLTEESHEKFKEFDKYYYAWNDGLNFLQWTDLPILNYFRHFPHPTADLTQFLTGPILREDFPNKKYLLCHLFSRPSSERKLDPVYIASLLKKLEEKLSSDYLFYIICEEKYQNFYARMVTDRIRTIDCSVEEIVFLAKFCSAFIGIDSMCRLWPAMFGKPVLCFSDFCPSPGQMPASQIIRWHVNPSSCIPSNYDVDKICKMINNVIQNPIAAMFPTIDSNFNQVILDRNLER